MIFDAALWSLPVWVIVVAALIIAAGAVAQASIGMGFGQVAAPLLAILDPELVPAPILILGTVTAIMGAIGERRGIVVSEVVVGVGGRIVGALGATVILSLMADRRAFTIVFGVSVLSAVILSVAGWRLPFNRKSLVAMAAVSGLTGTITSVGAPPMALVYQTRDAATARPTLNAFFAIGCLISLAALTASGWLGVRDIVLAAILTPAMLAGFAVAGYVRPYVDQRYRYVLWTLAGAASIVLIYKGLFIL